MRLGDFYSSIQGTADIECSMCGLGWDSSIGKCGTWWDVDGKWYHWCSGEWVYAPRIGEEKAVYIQLELIS